MLLFVPSSECFQCFVCLFAVFWISACILACGFLPVPFIGFVCLLVLTPGLDSICSVSGVWIWVLLSFLVFSLQNYKDQISIKFGGKWFVFGRCGCPARSHSEWVKYSSLVGGPRGFGGWIPLWCEEREKSQEVFRVVGWVKNKTLLSDVTVEVWI